MTTTLTHLSNDSLLSGIKELVHSERRLTTEIIHHLREILRRELHLKLGYNSLFTYMVEELKYCEGSAHRRISAMNLLNSIPMVEAKKVEEKISELELKIEEFEASFAKSNPSDETLEEYNKTKEDLDLALQEWEHLGTQLN